MDEHDGHELAAEKWRLWTKH